jgi:hypothetical protein
MSIKEEFRAYLKEAKIEKNNILWWSFSFICLE